MKPLHTLPQPPPIIRWVVFNYGDNIPETMHAAHRSPDGYGIFCRTEEPYPSEEEFMKNHIKPRKRDVVCKTCKVYVDAEYRRQRRRNQNA